MFYTKKLNLNNIKFSLKKPASAGFFICAFLRVGKFMSNKQHTQAWLVRPVNSPMMRTSR